MLNAPSSDTIGLGQRFRRAREQAGWTVAETAERLHIIPRFVSAIEEERFDELPGVVFVKGYVRAYARLLNLSESSVGDELDELLDARGLRNSEAAPQTIAAPPSKSPVTAILAGLLLLVAILAGLWFMAGGKKSAPVEGENLAESVSEEAPPVAEEGTQEDLEGDVLPVTPPEPGSAKDAEAEVDSGESAPLVVEGGTIPLEIRFKPPTSAESSAGGEAAPGLADAPAEESPERSSAESVTSQSQTEAVTGAEADGVPAVSVSVQFLGDCWFDVRDRNNERVVRLFREGQSVTFSGEPPLRFVIGAVDQARIQIDGQPLDLKRYPVRNNRVEFSWEQ